MRPILHQEISEGQNYPSHAPSFSAGGGRSAMQSGHVLHTTCQVSKSLERNWG